MVNAKTGVHSGMVRTVLGPIPVETMGLTLMHEHVVLDTSSWWKRPCCASEIGFAERPLDISMLGDLRINRFLNRDNCGLLDVKVAIEELGHFVEFGGGTVVDPTNSALAAILGAAAHQPAHGPQRRHGSRLLFEPSHPNYVKDMTVDAIAKAIATTGSLGGQSGVARGSSARSASARTSRPRRKKCYAARREPPKLVALH